MNALPVILGVVLVAIAAAAALLPLLRGAPAEPATAAPAMDPSEAERFQLYRQVLELEFDQQTGKLSAEDFEVLSREMLGRAGQLLHARQVEEAEDEAIAARPESDIDAEIEREIAAARKAFARARQEQREAEEVA